MSQEPTTGVPPRDHEAEGARRASRRRRWVAVAAGIGVVAAIGVAELTGGVVSRMIDATGWTCGNSWDRMDGDELADLRVIRWGSPEARDQGFDPEDFLDLPPGLAEPSLTTASDTSEGEYNPFLYPLGDGVVLQGSGYFDSAWVAVDAGTGEPLWGVEDDSSGFSTIHGRFALVAEREDGRTDLTTFDPRTGEELSCVRLDGQVSAMTAVGDSDLAVALHADGDEEGDEDAVVRVDPVAGRVVWTHAVEHAVGDLSADDQVVVVSSQAATTFSSGWLDAPTQVVALDAESGGEQWRSAPAEGVHAAIAVLTRPDGSSAVLVYGVADRAAWDRDEAQYALLDETGRTLWSTEATAQRWVFDAWQTTDVAVLLDSSTPFGVDLETGERLWVSDAVVADEDDAVMLGSGEDAVLLVSDVRRPAEDGGDAVFVTLTVDLTTGETTTYDAAMRSAELTDSYLLTSSGITQIVIPLEE